jgi:anti-sigma B factor antagonist
VGKDLMNLQTRSDSKGSLVMDVRGEVDLFSSPKLRAAIMAALSTPRVSRVAINLSEVSYIDSSGIASLVEGLQQAHTQKCPLVLFGLQLGPREVLEMARLDKIFTIRGSEPEALADL